MYINVYFVHYTFLSGDVKKLTPLQKNNLGEQTSQQRGQPTN